MDPKAQERALTAVIILCLIFIAVWWYRSPYGPVGKNKYGVVRLTWKNSATTAGVGDLVVALSRTPNSNVKGGTVYSIAPGLSVQPDTAQGGLTSAQAAAVEKLFSSLSGAAVSGFDAGGNTVTFGAIAAPAGWPGTATSVVWTATTVTGPKGDPSASLTITPSKNGS
jgi:hypothetical protein